MIIKFPFLFNIFEWEIVWRHKNFVLWKMKELKKQIKWKGKTKNRETPKIFIYLFIFLPILTDNLIFPFCCFSQIDGSETGMWKEKRVKG